MGHSGPGKVGLSADAWLAWDEETTYGTKVAVSSGSGFSLFTAESMRGQINIREVPNIAASHKDLAQTYVGSQIVEGDVTIAVPYDGISNLLLHALGEINDGQAWTSDSYLVNFDLADTGRYKNANSPSLTIHVSRGVVGSGVTIPSVFSYEGCVVDSFSFSCSRDGALLLTLTFFGQQETLATSSVTASFPTAPVANGTECTVTWGGTAIPVTDFTVTARRNIDRERFFLGSTQTYEPPMGQYQVEATVNTEWDNENRVGTATLRADYAAKTNHVLWFTFTSTDVIDGLDVTKYSFQINMPYALITQFPPNVTGQGRVLVPMTITGFDSSTISTPHEIRITAVIADTFEE